MAATEQGGRKPGRTSKAGFVLSWIWTILAGLAGAAGFFRPGQALAGTTLVLSALAACPLVASLLERQMGTRPAGGLRLALAIIFAGLAGLSIVQNPAELTMPAAAPIQPKTLLEDHGDFGNKTTKLFMPNSKDWDLQWSFDCAGLGDSGNFDAKVMRKGAGVSQFAVVEKINDRDSGTEHYHESGTFYLQVVSECRWDLKVIG